jgi:hypothetical protein
MPTSISRVSPSFTVRHMRDRPSRHLPSSPLTARLSARINIHPKEGANLTTALLKTSEETAMSKLSAALPRRILADFSPAIYRNVISAIVKVLAADSIDNSTKQSWQKLIDTGAGREIFWRCLQPEISSTTTAVCMRCCTGS